MKRYNRNDRLERGRGFRKEGSKDSGKSLMHKATCGNCGKECEVPFKPTGSKPVYCNNCFEKNQNEDPRRSGRERGARKFTSRDSRDRGFSGRTSGRPPMHVVVCDKCGEDCEVPFRPTKGKPVFCDKCFEHSDHKKEKSTELLKKELEVINKKLDKILEALTPAPTKKKNQKVVEVIEITEDPKPEKKTKKTIATKTAVKKLISAKKTTASKTGAKKPVSAKKAIATKTAVKKPVSAKKTTKKT